MKPKSRAIIEKILISILIAMLILTVGITKSLQAMTKEEWQAHKDKLAQQNDDDDDDDDDDEDWDDEDWDDEDWEDEWDDDDDWEDEWEDWDDDDYSDVEISYGKLREYFSQITYGDLEGNFYYSEGIGNDENDGYKFTKYSLNLFVEAAIQLYMEGSGYEDFDKFELAQIEDYAERLYNNTKDRFYLTEDEYDPDDVAKGILTDSYSGESGSGSGSGSGGGSQYWDNDGNLDPNSPSSGNESNNLDNNFWGEFITPIDAQYPNVENYNKEIKDPGVAVPKTMTGNMPQRSTAGPSGMFPQYYGAPGGTPVRKVTLPDNRGELETAEWATVTDGTVVFCAAYRKTVRFGKYEDSKHYYDTATGINLNPNEALISVEREATVYTYGEIEKILEIYLQHYYSKGDNDAYKYYYLTNRYTGEIEDDGYSKRKAGSPYVRSKYITSTYPENVSIEISSNVPGNLQNSLCYPIISSMDFPGGGVDSEGMSLSMIYPTPIDAMNASQAKAFKVSSDLFQNIKGQTSTKHYQGAQSTTDSSVEANPTINPFLGPIAVVLENSDHASDGYKLSEQLEFLNNAKAYIFSSADNDFDAKNNYQPKYNLNDIQGAYWRILHDEGGIRPTNHMTANAIPLYNKAKEFEQFMDEIKDGYEPKIEDSGAQVIVDREHKKYVVGPYKLDYLQHEDISYVKALYLDTDNGQMVYDEKHNDIQVIMDGEGIKGSNGLLKEYPNNGQSFFIVFDAEKAGFPTEVELNVKFEYIEEAYASGQNLRSTAKGYRYNGHCLIAGNEKYTMDKYQITIDIYCTKGDSEQVTYDCGGENCRGNHKATYYWNEYNVQRHHLVYDVYFPYVQMDTTEEWDKEAQTLTITGFGQSRPVKVDSKIPEEGEAPGPQDDYGEKNIYRIYSYKEAKVKINLTMELGGFVWVDENSGKEDGYDGKASDSEKRIPNMNVTLESVKANGAKGTQTQTAKTDANGKYKFTGLNAMFQYRFIFEYNAQYYQPTTWAASSTWGTAEWNTNSNAKDSEKERENYNLGFKVIGANRGTYALGGNTNASNDDVAISTISGRTNQDKYSSYTRDELKTAGAIDDFGLPSNGGDAKMKQYVSDCMLKAYTCGEPNSENVDGLYPYPSLFVIDKAPVSRAYMSCFQVEPVRLYLNDNAYCINLGLNPRQQSDMIIKKDIHHVDLEINGLMHRYTYDSLETQINEDESWTVGVHTSDAFKNNYGTSYTRELYKSDYLYKASNYGAVGASLGKKKSDELEVYITYKIMLRNQANSIRMRIDELVDYYDEDLQYVDERSYIEITLDRGNDAAKPNKYKVKADYNAKTEESNSLYKKDTIPGYKNLYITGLGLLDDNKNSYNNYLAAGQTAYVYLTFRVKKDTIDGEDWIKLDEELQSGNPIGVGKENIVEINGYSTQYANGTTVPNRGNVSYKPAGILDRDSNSGNVTEAITHKDIAADSPDLNKLEDDTGKAPNMRLILYRDDDKNRVIEGNVFEDARDNTLDITTIGDGIKANNETLIDGVTVQLVEIMENGQEFVWREFGTGKTPENRPESEVINIDGNYLALAIDENGNKAGGSGKPDSGKEETPIINYSFADNTNLVANHNFGDNVKGAYAFKSFIPGRYVVRYIYGDTIKTVAPSSLGGSNEISYNGQDYKSTAYQKGVEQNKIYTWEQTAIKYVPEGNGFREWNEETDRGRLDYQYFYKTYNGTNYEISYAWYDGEKYAAPKLTEVQTFNKDASNNERVILPKSDEILKSAFNIPVISSDKQVGYLYDITASDNVNNRPSDAKDIESRRNAVNTYSNAQGKGVTNYLAEVLASHKTDYDYNTMYRNNLLKDLMTNTQMRAETGLIVIDLEYDSKETEYEKNTQGQFRITNVDFGIEERPKSQIVIDKQVTNARIIRADGATLFDAKPNAPATNVTWRKHGEYDIGYNNKKLLDQTKFESIPAIRDRNKGKFGLIQFTMDEELMHGATVQITYDVKVTNVGEVDYYNIYYTASGNKTMQDRKFYYKGEVTQEAQIVTTRADQVLDYVANNLQFKADVNGNWHIITLEQIKKDENENVLVNSSLDSVLQTYNTIISTENLNKDLLPLIADSENSSIKIPLILTQMITAENDTDDLTYRNIVEIVKTTNTVGRRMEYSVVGNQDPTYDPQELDSDKAEVVRILPPFGNAGLPIMIIVITIAGAALAVGGIFFIKKKVLNK